MTKAVLVIHGGAGTILRANLTPTLEEAYQSALRESLQVGYAILENGGTALDAACASVCVMEDNPLFNAGRGAVFTHEGRNEMDAAVMDGKTRAAGAVAGTTRAKNPILLARAVMEQSPFVFLAGPGADEFAQTVDGLELAPPDYFATPERWNQLETLLAREREGGNEQIAFSLSEDNKFGTVGAAARDRNGNLAAATSTGGMTNKRYGRVGDSPIIGAGTWADNATCAISATGHGEPFIRNAVAHDIAARVAYGGNTLAEASHTVIWDVLKPRGGAGGVIALDVQGNAALPFNTAGIYRAIITEDGEMTVGIYAENGIL